MRIRILKIIIFFWFGSIANTAELEAVLDWSSYQKYSFAVNGVVDEVAIAVGQKVKKGELIISLLSQPFRYKIQKCQAKLNKLSTPILNAKIELEQAEELFEQTVLSEFELQKIDSVYNVLKQQEKEVKAECLLEELYFDWSKLKARESAYVLSSNIDPGLVISDENKSSTYIELVSAKKASAISLLTYNQKTQLKIGNELKVLIDAQEFPAKIKSIEIQANVENKYKIVAEFYYTKTIEPGKLIKIKY